MLSATFNALRSKDERALILFVTAGDPSLEALPDILDELEAAGADIIEVGVPFSDPIADGPVIQAASQRSLDRGTTPQQVLQYIGKRRGHAPIVLMGYYNTILSQGLHRFAAEASAARVCGTIISDLTPEESDDWIQASKEAQLDTILLAAPTSTDDRLRSVGLLTSGFVYAVSRTGVTGVQSELSGGIGALVGRIREFTAKPICVGFGISSAEQVRSVAQVADGVVIGSWLVQQLAEGWSDPARRSAILDTVREMKAATRL